MNVTLRLIFLTLRFIQKSEQNMVSPHLFDSHIFVVNVKPFCNVFSFLCMFSICFRISNRLVVFFKINLYLCTSYETDNH